MVVFDAEPWERESLERLSARHDLLVVQEPLNARTARRHADAEAVSVFIYSRVDRPVLEALPNLRLIATRSTGFDHIRRFAAGQPQNRVAA